MALSRPGAAWAPEVGVTVSSVIVGSGAASGSGGSVPGGTEERVVGVSGCWLLRGEEIGAGGGVIMTGSGAGGGGVTTGVGSGSGTGVAGSSVVVGSGVVTVSGDGVTTAGGSVTGRETGGSGSGV
jgi:hypothetical protein